MPVEARTKLSRALEVNGYAAGSGQLGPGWQQYKSRQFMILIIRVVTAWVQAKGEGIRSGLLLGHFQIPIHPSSSTIMYFVFQAVGSD